MRSLLLSLFVPGNRIENGRFGGLERDCSKVCVFLRFSGGNILPVTACECCVSLSYSMDVFLFTLLVCVILSFVYRAHAHQAHANQQIQMLV